MKVGGLIRFDQNLLSQQILYPKRQSSDFSDAISSTNTSTRQIDSSYLMNKNIVSLNSKKTNVDNSLSSTEGVTSIQKPDQDSVSIINEAVDDDETPEEYTQRLDGIKEAIREVVIKKEAFSPLWAEALLLVGKNQSLYTDGQLFQELKFIYEKIIEKHPELTNKGKQYFTKQIDQTNQLIERSSVDSIEDSKEFIESLHEVIHVERQGLGSLNQKIEWLESVYFVLSIRAKTKEEKSFYENKMSHMQKYINKLNPQNQSSLEQKICTALKAYIREYRKEELDQYYNQSNI
ncbi:MAG: hypothetical protein ACRDDW_00550 [Candidatus Rhabdochlamydia sp.]